MSPAPGSRLQRFIGDRIRFTLADSAGRPPAKGWQARLRTNLGRAALLQQEVLEAHTRVLPLAGASWRDLAMQQDDHGWSLELPLVEVGYFKAKAYLLDPKGWQHWPEGADFGISVHPDCYRTANTIYCAFPRMFGATKSAKSTRDEKLINAVKPLDEAGYAVIPPSGKLRDVTAESAHILHTLGCRILHLLPIHPTPTTYARFGRYGSPYAAEDLTAIDPALVVFDKRTTGVEQFQELTYAIHSGGAQVFLDIVINHTGWGSILQENHPEWFLRNPDGSFASPGAWGVTWEDLVELKHQHVALWDNLSEMFLTWCRRGVDGFRCDAGYKVPVAAWQYIVARVRQEYPETIFLLEGLGGAWEATEALLTDGGMQWAYSELFQNFSGPQVSHYLDHSFLQSERVGLLVHYSETHDNERLAARGRAWSLLRNRLCALASNSGGFGFTCGVEWLAAEKIVVHGSSGMAWNSPENLVPELAKLNHLLAEHPCFFDGAAIKRVSPTESPVLALWRESEERKDFVLVLVNTDVDAPRTLTLKARGLPVEGNLSAWAELLGQALPPFKSSSAEETWVTVPPGGAFCLSPSPKPAGLSGDEYRRVRARAAWALTAMRQVIPTESIGDVNWRELAAKVEQSPARFLANIGRRESDESSLGYPAVVTWSLPDVNRELLVPPGHWLLLEDSAPFRASLQCDDGDPNINVQSVPVGKGHIASFPPRHKPADGKLIMERYASANQHVEASLRFLSSGPGPDSLLNVKTLPQDRLFPSDLVLLTNGRGAMARLCVDFGSIRSKYDCVLGANLHPTLPVDRHVLAKRIRLWVNADGFISPLDFRNLVHFAPGPPASWSFVANAGDGRTVEIDVIADMLEGRNTTVFHFIRPGAAQAKGKQLPPNAEVRLTARLDLEDRNFHSQTKYNGGADYHFSTNTHVLAEGPNEQKVGFVFTPATDRQLRVFANAGIYHPQPEWSYNIAHPIEQNRGQEGSGDAYSSGWFDLPLPKGATVTLVATAELEEPDAQAVESSRSRVYTSQFKAPFPADDKFGQHLLRAVRAYVVRRGNGQTVIAGYPWFLDWGRDTFICARGLLAAGMHEEVKQILLTFARFEKDGTLPNTIFGEDASNRDTSDAPLWFGVVCEELAPAIGSLYRLNPSSGRTVGDVLESIALNYIRGTPNGIRMDPESALIWSPSHFTWMDTNYPAGTPREGYPVEIQALWIRLLRQLGNIAERNARSGWQELAERALNSLEKLYWREELGWYADVLNARQGQSAAQAVVDDGLRCNCLLLIGLGLVRDERARRCVEAASRYLLVPGALRSLAPLPSSIPRPVVGNGGQVLNDPRKPYWGRYEGDEDTRRKPAYHNGTAWGWFFPVFCEALARAWDFSSESLLAARAYMGSLSRVMSHGCIGQLPEIMDGDAPHTLRGCDAQAWSVTEALRVWKLLQAQGSISVSEPHARPDR